MTRFSHYLPRIVVSVLIFGAVLLLPEAGARVVYRLRHGEWPVSLATVTQRSRASAKALFLEHSILPFVLRPGASVTFMDSAVEINASGYRGPELRSETPLRILAVGASTTFDTGVTDYSRTWTHQLERHLGSTLPGTEVVNGGVPVYNLWTNYLKYVLYDRYARPDVVLIYQGIADTLPWWPTAYDELLSTDYWLFRGAELRSWSGLRGERKLAQDPLLPGLFARSVFLRGAYNERGRNENVYANMTRARTVDECMPDALLDKSVDILRYFVNAVRLDGAVPILVPQTIGSPTRKRVYGENFPVFVGGLHKLNAGYVRYAREAGVKVVDVTAVTDEWGDEHFKDFLHFNDLGSMEMAVLLARDLAEDGTLRRLHAAHQGRTGMPTRILAATVAFDRPPEPLPKVADVSVALISTAVHNFGVLEGPYPQWNMHRPVRWMEGKEADIRFTAEAGDKPYVLKMTVRSIAPDQKIQVQVNGKPVVEYAFKKIGEWETVVSREFTLAPENELSFRAARTVGEGGRELGVLFEDLAIVAK